MDGEVAEVTYLVGHADLAGIQVQVHGRAERARARQRAGDGGARGLRRAGQGLPARAGVEVRSHVLRIGSVEAPANGACAPEDFEDVDASPVRCLDAEAGAAMVEEIDRLRRANESLGGVFGAPSEWCPGLALASPWEERLDGRLAQAIMSIQSLKGVGVGRGFALAGVPGSRATRSSGPRSARLLPRDQPRRRPRGGA